MSDQKLGSRIIPTDNVDFIAETNDGVIIEVFSALCDENHKVISVTDIEGKIYLQNEIKVYNKAILIPGIGYLVPGTRVVYKNKDYRLSYGWHTNISNQTILSWYLEPLETDEPMKTLYKEMIDEIELVHFR